MTQPAFALESDLEFYPFLKLNLPRDYKIVAEPQKGYYSEWQFCYKVYHGADLLTTYTGNFCELAPGTLVQAAKALLEKLEVSNADWQ